MRLGPAAFVLALAGLLSGCRGDPVQCDKGCRNYFTLNFWKQADAEIAKASPAERDALRQKKLADLNKGLENGVDMCVSQCVSVGNTADTECMVGAKTADQVRACVGADEK
ncbi:MAG TPA: hypothetical protein VFP84_16770 [Kofleriaceae bacterium]|nr:hypothetical protein [Kofleriaceae bacterium]